MTKSTRYTARIATLGWMLGVACWSVRAQAATTATTDETNIGPAPERTRYPLEVEPHLSFGEFNVYGAAGYGAGLRVAAPFAGGHIGSAPENLAVGVGVDLLHYSNCFYSVHCSANYIFVPAALQWNVAVFRTVTVFAEGGAYLYKGFFDACALGETNCSAPPDFGVLPTIALGGRLHVGENVAVTLRLGYPTTTLGVSFL